MIRTSANDNQDTSSIYPENINEVKKRKLNNDKNSLFSIEETLTEFKYHNFVNLCRNTAIDKNNLEPCSDVVVEGLNCFHFVVYINLNF